MSNFDFAVSHVFESEGGYVDHPNDMGGPTNFGITMPVLSKFRDKICTKSDMKNLTIEEASLIYKKFYWDALSLDGINSKILSYLVFDQGINRGISSSARQIQECVGATTDGKIGPATILKINSFLDQKRLCVEFIKKSQIFYSRIAQNTPSQSVFIVGWISRTHKLLDMVLYVP